jgi:hypothetical protein
MTEDPFGPIIGVEDVVQAAVTVLRNWTPQYLFDQETKAGLQIRQIPRPPTPESYHGGLDWESWIGAQSPEVMVIAKPTGKPELSSHGYTQAYSLEVGCLCIGPGGLFAERAEDDARIMASYLGAGSMLLVQQPPGLFQRLRLVGAPDPSFPDPERRAIVQIVTGYEVWVDQIIGEAAPVGLTPKEAPGYEGPEEPFAETPVVETVDIVVKPEQGDS